jgi:hypothetical protein
MDKRAAWASIALVPMVSACSGGTTQDHAAAGGVPIATIGSQGNEAIAVDSHYVYCADPGAGLVRVPVSGGIPVVLSNNVGMTGLVPALAVDANNVYWSAPGLHAGGPTVLLSQPLAGGTNTPISDSGQSVLAVAADGQNVYWLEEQTAPGTTAADGTMSGAVMRAPSAGGAGAPVMVAPARFLYSGGRASIAVDSNVIYWTDACPANSGVDYCGGELMKVPVAGGTPVRLATWSGFMYSQIKVGPGGVYWAVPGTQSTMQPPPPTGILRVPLAGGDPVMVIAPPALAITLDEANIYWTNYGDMMRAPLPSGAPATRVATPASNGFDLAVDATSLYWVDSGTLMKLTPK